MGQNNDVCWTFTNVMADVQDLFIERIEGDRYLFEDEWRPLEIGRARRSRSRAAPSPSVLEVRDHPPRPDRQRGARRRRGRAAGAALADARRADRLRRHVRAARDRLRAGAGRPRSRATRRPASNLIWADRHGSIGYKLIGRLPLRRGGCPDLPKPGWTGEFEWEGTIPYDELPEADRPRERLPGHRQQPDRRRRVPAPHHQRVVRRLPRASGSKSCSASREEHDLDDFERDADRRPLAARARGGAAAGPPAARRPARAQRDRAAAQLGRAARPRPDRRHDLPGLPAAPRPRGGARRDRRPRPLRALARPRRQRLHAPTSPRPGAGTRT